MVQECKKCEGKGGIGAFGPCLKDDIHFKNVCPCCDGLGSSVRQYECPKCGGKGGWHHTFGGVETNSVHFEKDCPTCEGKCYVPYEFWEECSECNGKGGLGTFGACDPGDVHFKEMCNKCDGAGYLKRFPQLTPVAGPGGSCHIVSTQGVAMYQMQQWQECITCHLTGHYGACMACIASCHAGHDLGRVRQSLFYCDCGAAADRVPCQCIKWVEGGASAAPQPGAQVAVAGGQHGHVHHGQMGNANYSVKVEGDPALAAEAAAEMGDAMGQMMGGMMGGAMGGQMGNANYSVKVEGDPTLAAEAAAEMGGAMGAAMGGALKATEKAVDVLAAVIPKMTVEVKTAAAPEPTWGDALEFTVAAPIQAEIEQYKRKLVTYGGEMMGEGGGAFLYTVNTKSDMKEYVNVQPMPRRWRQWRMFYNEMVANGLNMPGFTFPEKTMKAYFKEDIRMDRLRAFQQIMDAVAKDSKLRTHHSTLKFAGGIV